jgi:hypothetical protein
VPAPDTAQRPRCATKRRRSVANLNRRDNRAVWHRPPPRCEPRRSSKVAKASFNRSPRAAFSTVESRLRLTDASDAQIDVAVGAPRAPRHDDVSFPRSSSFVMSGLSFSLSRLRRIAGPATIRRPAQAYPAPARAPPCSCAAASNGCVQQSGRRAQPRCRSGRWPRATAIRR